MILKKSRDIVPIPARNCHDGEGVLLCKDLLDGAGSKFFEFMHSDELPAGVAIGIHEHINNEEVYYLISGKGILTYDGVEYEMLAGDISLCKDGHSHGFKAVEDCRLIVVGGGVFL